MGAPRVTVIIPAYNAGKFLEKCLRSLREQTFGDFEVIVVDDGSADNTFEIAKKMFSVLKTPKNSGAGAARNLGVKKARGGIVAFTDADVVLPPGWIENIVKALEEHRVSCVGGGYCGSLGDSFIERFQFYELLDRRKDIPPLVKTIVSNNFACYRKVFEEAGGFPENFRAASLEDMVLSCRISRNHQIYWHRENGVYHHFKNSLKGYLRQQYVFGRDTVLTYYHFPELFLVKTHQGRRLYLEVAVTLLTLVLSFYSLSFLLWGTLVIMSINLSLLRLLYKQELSVAGGLLVILLRNLVVVASLVAGAVLSAGEFFRRSAPAG